ncbi:MULTISPECIES: MFS transporter [Clostridium]|uniref:MFS transporter n=1 Tax=Clostridium cibarium TaxID=2762247 RepID=A0ABR8PTT4_9CLOT|nr:MULTISPECIES: MFS transporter [Clostridium]MBD7911566.1 MFS transporter [Clostridium cibarium]
MNLKLLKDRNLVLLITAKFISLIGSQLQTFALSLYVLALTGSATNFAIVTAISIIPRIVIGPLAGVIADWFNRKKIIVYTDLLSGIIVGIYWVMFRLNGEISLIGIYFLAVILSVISSIFLPAISTILPSIVKKDDLVDANGLDSLTTNIGNLIAPLIGGILFTTLGLEGILLINSISFIFSAIGEMFINIPKLDIKSEKLNTRVFITEFFEGIKFVKQKSFVFNIIILALVLNFALSPIFSLGLTYIGKQVLKITDSQYGIMESILMASMIISPFIVSKLNRNINPGKIMFLSIFSSSLLTVLIALISSDVYTSLFSSNFVPYISIIVVGFIIGMITSIANISVTIIIQKEIPLTMMGRVSAVISTGCVSAVPIGQLIFGILFDNFEAWVCIIFASLILLITILKFRISLLKGPEKELELNKS